MLIIKEISITIILFFEINIAETAGIIRKEKTGITPFTFTANTIDKPIDI